MIWSRFESWDPKDNRRSIESFKKFLSSISFRVCRNLSRISLDFHN